MLKYPFITLISMAVLSGLGCGGGAPANSAANNTNRTTVNINTAANTNAPINVAPANLQPQPVISPATPPANAAGVPSNATVVQKGATTTPGTPGVKMAKPGATPTPGTPSQAEILRMMAKPSSNANSASMKGGDVPMMKSNRPLGGKPH